MKRYLRIYKQFIVINIAEVMAYRARFIGDTFSSLMWGSFHLISIYVLTHRITTVYGWRKEELYLLIATFSIMWGIFRCLFMENFRKFSDLILKGHLDSLLMKPIDSQFWATTKKIGFDELVRILMGVGFMLYIITTYHIQLTPFSLVLYFGFMLFALLSIYSLWFLFSSLLIWYPQLTNMRELLSYISGIMKYPPEVLKGFGSSAVLLFTPILFVIAVPTKVLTSRVNSIDLLWFSTFSIFFFLATRIFWKHALKSYTSVNS